MVVRVCVHACTYIFKERNTGRGREREREIIVAMLVLKEWYHLPALRFAQIVGLKDQKMNEFNR